MRRSARLLVSLQHAAHAATVQLPEHLRSSRPAWAALPALSALAQAPLAWCVSGGAASQLSSPQPWQSWSPAAAAAIAPLGQQRGFAARPSRNKRVQAALQRQRRAQQHQAAPATYDAEPAPRNSAEPGSEVVPSEAPPSALEVCVAPAQPYRQVVQKRTSHSVLMCCTDAA